MPEQTFPVILFDIEAVISERVERASVTVETFDYVDQRISKDTPEGVEIFRSANGFQAAEDSEVKVTLTEHHPKGKVSESTFTVSTSKQLDDDSLLTYLPVGRNTDTREVDELPEEAVPDKVKEQVYFSAHPTEPEVQPAPPVKKVKPQTVKEAQTKEGVKSDTGVDPNEPF